MACEVYVPAPPASSMTVNRRATSTGERCLVTAHAKSCLTPEPLRTLRPETKGQAAACPDRTQAIPCKLPGRLLPMAWAELTATATATAAANSTQQQPAAAHNARTIRANLGYARPEKQTVEDQRRSAATVANTVARPLDSARRNWTTLKYRPSLRPVTDSPWTTCPLLWIRRLGFESLQARPGQRPLPIMEEALAEPALGEQTRQYFDRRVCGVSRNIGGFTEDAALPAFV